MSEAELAGCARMPISVFFAGELAHATDGFADGRRIGAGGFGSVYKAWPLEGAASSAEMAVKRLDPESMQGKTEFLQELQVLGGCRHEHLLPLVGFSADEARGVCLVSPLMRGGSLHDRLFPAADGAQRRLALLMGAGRAGAVGPLTWRERLEVGAGVARALEYLHAPDPAVHKPAILHRDVKPGNVLLDHAGHARLADVGLARLRPDSSTHVTMTQVAGTTGFLDPNFLQTGHYGAWSDGYALGVTLLMLLSGRPASEDGKTVVSRCRKASAEAVADAQAGWPGAAAGEVLRVGLGLAAFEPEERMEVGEAARRLEAALHHAGDHDEDKEGEEGEGSECVVCLAAPHQVRFGCGHAVVCLCCLRLLLARRDAACPHCRAPIDRDSITYALRSLNTFVAPPPR